MVTALGGDKHESSVTSDNVRVSEDSTLTMGR